MEERIVQELKNIVIELKKINKNMETNKENKKQVLNEVNIGSEGDNINKYNPLNITEYNKDWKLTNVISSLINKLDNNNTIKISEK